MPPTPARAAPWTALALVLPLASLLAGCEEEYVPPPEPVRPVKLLEVKGGVAGITREYPGRIRAVQQADMAFEVPGRIVEFPVKEGDRVQEGALLARLDPRDYQARVDSARADYGNAKVNFERAQKLFSEGALSELNRDQRRTAMQIAEATLREAEKALEDTELRAPFSGVMARKLVEDFENVAAKQQVLVLQDESAFELRVAVPERDLSGSRERDEIDLEAITRQIRPRVVVTSIPDREFSARLEQIATIADPETRTFEATFVFPRPAGVQILPGMTATALIELRGAIADSAIHIPARAAAPDAAGNANVWLVDPQSMTVTRRPVELGELRGSQVEILGGLEGGELIAISGVHQLREGMEVRRWQPQGG